ncbi:MAG: type IV pilus twitching motility protein PilT [Myxococcales bacterium]|nr:type IV pilus twitching motility protein PilT [Myxococcales bacterium]
MPVPEEPGRRPSAVSQRIEKAELAAGEEPSLELDTGSLGGTSARAQLRVARGDEVAQIVAATSPTPQAEPGIAAPAAAPTIELARSPALELAPGLPAEPVVRAAPALGVTASPRRSATVDALLAQAVQRHASDIHLHSGLPPTLRLHGLLVPFEGIGPIRPAEAEQMAREVLTEGDWEGFQRTNDLDFAYAIPGVGRFRANAYRQQHGIDLVFRAIPLTPPTLESLGLPAGLAKFVSHHQGLVLCTGPAGSGKSSTMAALLNHINHERSQHIITVEDPIEFIHPSKRCLVRQRQVHTHTESFSRALRAAVREDPNVIGIGELRDHETVELALSASETGSLVIGSLHTNNAIRTINRVVDAFPPEQQQQVRVMLSGSLKGVVSQRLVKRADGRGRVAALEVLVVTRAVANLIREEKVIQIRSVMQVGKSQGMVLLDDSLRELVSTGTITREEARLQAESPALFA